MGKSSLVYKGALIVFRLSKKLIMAEIRVAKDVFLRCMALIYGVAFASLFIQIPGLYGDNGILPARVVLAKVPDSWKDFMSQPTLLRFFPMIGWDIQTGMDVLCLLGITVAFLTSVSSLMRNMLSFFLLWSFYLSVFHVGQTFLWFQWDILLLEAGFITVFVAPFPCARVSQWFCGHDKVAFWMVRWLLFRLMFASGVVKLTSGCPTWWGLTALNYHYETQCIPTPLAWYFHQLPGWFHQLSVVMTFLIELPLSFLFFSPFSSHRVFAAFTQVLLMVMIILTGNYNFFNWLTIALCVSLLDDNHLNFWAYKRKSREMAENQWMKSFRWTAHVAVALVLVYTAWSLFSVRLNLNFFEINTKIAFSYEAFDQFLQVVVPVTILIGAFSLCYQILAGIVWSLTKIPGLAKKTTNVLGCLAFGVGAILLFSISLVSYTRIEPETQRWLPVELKLWNQMTASSFRLTSSYGLFRRMTGIGRRPEVIVEGSNFLDGPWKEYQFHYKPGNVSQKPPIVAPHQPRLDWQMWFAALSMHERHPWFLGLVYRLLTNQPEVLQLIRVNPFEKEPPRFIRANLYYYHFTSSNSSSNRYSDRDWWTRKVVRQYLPPRTKSNPELIRMAKYLQKDNEELLNSQFCDVIQNGILHLRSVLTDGFTTCTGFVMTSLVITTAGHFWHHIKSFSNP